MVPTQANTAALNSAFGSGGWVYLGTVPYGNNNNRPNALIVFSMSGNQTVLASSTTTVLRGAVLRAQTGTTLTWTYSAGSSLASNQVPVSLLIGDLQLYTEPDTNIAATAQADTNTYAVLFNKTSSSSVIPIPNYPLALGLINTTAFSVAQALSLTSYQDSLLK
jgi:hypothetical protein